jgi:hypothetical protein
MSKNTLNSATDLTRLSREPSSGVANKKQIQEKDSGTQNMISVKTKLLLPLLLLFLFTCHFYYRVSIIKFYALFEKENCLEADLLFVINSLKFGSKTIADYFVHGSPREGIQYKGRFVLCKMILNKGS